MTNAQVLYLTVSRPAESRLKRWASVAFPLVAALFVLALPVLQGSRVPDSGWALQPGAFWGLVASGAALTLLLALCATFAGECVSGAARAAPSGQTGRCRWTPFALRLANATGPSARTIADCEEVRWVLFVFAAERAALAASDAEVDSLASRLSSVVRGIAPDASLDRALLDVCGNTSVRDWILLCDRTLEALGGKRSALSARRRLQWLAAWRGLIEALRSRDSQTAANVARRLGRVVREGQFDGRVQGYQDHGFAG